MTISDKIIRAKNDYNEVYEAGKKAEYDAFWNNYQQNGTLTCYWGAFAGQGWNKDTFNPKYKIAPIGITGAQYMFMAFNSSPGAEMFNYDTIKHLIDWSQVKNMNGTFMDANMDNINIDCPNVTTFTQCFSQGNLGTAKITTIHLKTSGSVTSFSGAFSYCSALKNLIFKEGSVIPVNISVQHSPLTKESITSVIHALSDTAIGKTATFKKTAKESAFTDSEWTELIATKPNWSIVLA